jgi:hypothetical protein
MSNRNHEESAYDRYEFSARLAAKDVAKAIRSGAVLTRREELDFLFKCLISGRTEESKLVRLPKQDKNLVKFLAKQFARVGDFYDNGSSFEGVRKYFKGLAFDAWLMGVSDGLYAVKVSDWDGKIAINMYKGAKLVHTGEMEDMSYLAAEVACMASEIGSDMESEEDREFVAGYLYEEFEKMYYGEAASIYVDDRRHNLDDVLRRKEAENHEKSSEKSESKILKFKAC